MWDKTLSATKACEIQCWMSFNWLHSLIANYTCNVLAYVTICLESDCSFHMCSSLYNDFNGVKTLKSLSMCPIKFDMMKFIPFNHVHQKFITSCAKQPLAVSYIYIK